MTQVTQCQRKQYRNQLSLIRVFQVFLDPGHALRGFCPEPREKSYLWLPSASIWVLSVGKQRDVHSRWRVSLIRVLQVFRDPGQGQGVWVLEQRRRLLVGDQNAGLFWRCELGWVRH